MDNRVQDDRGISGACFVPVIVGVVLAAVLFAAAVIGGAL